MANYFVGLVTDKSFNDHVPRTSFSLYTFWLYIVLDFVLKLLSGSLFAVWLKFKLILQELVQNDSKHWIKGKIKDCIIIVYWAICYSFNQYEEI